MQNATAGIGTDLETALAQSTVIRTFYNSHGSFTGEGCDGNAPCTFNVLFASEGLISYCQTSPDCTNDGNEYTKNGEYSKEKRDVAATSKTGCRVEWKFNTTLWEEQINAHEYDEEQDDSQYDYMVENMRLESDEIVALVTDFLPNHPGGAKIILQLAGQDATEEYDPVHPPGILEDTLRPEAKLGRIDPNTLPKEEKSLVNTEEGEDVGPPPLDSLLNLDDIEETATKLLSGKAWAYYYSAGDDLISKRLNNTAYRSILLRPRIFIDCEKCDTSTTLLGQNVNIPLYVSPAAMARLAHPSGEHGIAQACRTFGAMQLISNNASLTPEQIVAGAAPNQVFGWQLYAQIDRAKSEAMLARINALPAIKFVCLTLDAPTPGKREHDERAKNLGANLPVRSAVQEGSASTTSPDPQASKPGGIGAALFAGTSPSLTWKTTLPWLAAHTHLPIVLKGIQTHEDAYIASLHAPQVKGIILSNHGGRAADTAPPAVHTLLEIRKYCPDVFERVEVWVDGGIRRGTDVVKALCLGARGVGIGRAPLYGLGVGGREGVERVFEILKAEVETCMRLLGVERVDQLGLQHINARAVARDIYDGPAGLDSISVQTRAKL